MILPKVFYQWLPIVDKHRYRPLPVSVDFLQNVFDLVFLLFFIWYWNWGPVLVVLYYVIETLVMCVFTSLKWWKSKAKLTQEQTVSTSRFRVITILSWCFVVCIFSYGQISTVHYALRTHMSLPTWNIIWSDDKQFLLGVLAIVLQQTAEYYKYNMLSKNTAAELLRTIFTPVLRIVVQQFAIMLGVFVLLVVNFDDLKSLSIMMALMFGLIKIIFGQLQLAVKKGNTF